MNNRKKEATLIVKTEAKVIAYSVICLVIIVIGISYALFFQVKKNENSQIVKAGTLTFSYSNGDIISSETKSWCFMPMNDTTALANKETCGYDIVVTNNGTLPADYSLKLTTNNPDNPLDLTKAKVYLLKDGSPIDTYPKTYNAVNENNNNLIEHVKINAGGRAEYKVVVYVDEELITTADDGKKISLNINGIGEVSTDDGINPSIPLPSDEICNGKEESGACYIAKKTDTESEEPELMYDDTEDKNLRYIGATPDNYIDIGDKTSDGQPILWRIIGIMKNVTTLDSGSETQEDLIKIIRADSIGTYSWDTSASEINGGWGVNEWSQADLMKLLNPKEVYNNEEPEIGGSLYWNSGKGSCYSGEDDANKTCDFTSSGISAEAKQKIAKVRWNTGTFATYDAYYSEWTASATYQAERSEYNGKQLCAGKDSAFCNDEEERTTKWDGYIGLVNPSDFGYAVGKSVRETCLAKSMHDYHKDDCGVNDWLKSNSGEWTLNPVPYRSRAINAFLLSGGYLGYSATDGAYGVWPVAYLKSSTTLTDALGTQDDPFVAS